MRHRTNLLIPYLIGIAIVLCTVALMLVQGCTIRKYQVTVYATEGSHVNISPEILAEVPHTTTVTTEGELTLPGAKPSVIGK